MTRFIQLHALTVYAPSNLNRDDTGRPKTARFGGVERLRISSQATKRAIRESEAFKNRAGEKHGIRTQRFGEQLHEYLISKGFDDTKAKDGARKIAAIFGKPKPANDANALHIEQLAFLSPEEQQAAFTLADKLTAGEELPDSAKELATSVLRDADTAIDIAMFGRMLADNPAFNREAAVQIAHAITTHRVDVEDDFYTAVDDLKKKEEDAGAGFIGELGFGSGVFYLYACIDRDLLESNLGGNKELAATAIAALTEGLALASPSGKQNSFASRSRASYLRVEKGTHQPCQLSAAFLKPVSGDNLLETSIDALETHACAMNTAYGDCFTGSPCVMRVPGGGSLEECINFAASEEGF